MPRHQAEKTNKPVLGKRMRTIRIVNSRFSPEKPGAMTAIRKGVASTPMRTRKEVVNPNSAATRSEEHTSELQSHSDLVCRLLLEKKKKKKKQHNNTNTNNTKAAYNNVQTK